MNNKVGIKGNYLLFIVGILLISLVLNVYQNITYKQYKDYFERQSYDNLEEIRYRNESILAILNSSISAKSISNDELLVLYKNYNEISDREVDLWEHFFKYERSPFIKIKGKDSQSINVNKNQNYWRIGELVYTYLQKDIKENVESLQLEGKASSDFVMMKNLSNDLNDFYIEFYSKKCSGLEEEKRAKKIIKNNYWVDMIQGIEEVNERYVDYPFIYE